MLLYNWPLWIVAQNVINSFPRNSFIHHHRHVLDVARENAAGKAEIGGVNIKLLAEFVELDEDAFLQQCANAIPIQFDINVADHDLSRINAMLH